MNPYKTGMIPAFYSNRASFIGKLVLQIGNVPVPRGKFALTVGNCDLQRDLNRFETGVLPAFYSNRVSFIGKLVAQIGNVPVPRGKFALTNRQLCPAKRHESL
ncbi:hypothetical protein [Labilibaculum antarcticum]|uniref:hypothetical protein n=1 Tax=Labilibaculum antarcticum TaxID=1717717 RepID=UPI0011AB351B|nr:hypothetical protein [Labilibaculum antarcticum]